MLIDGKATAQKIQNNILSAVSNLKGRRPGLAVILIGDHAPSHAYVRMKRKACLEVGLFSEVFQLPNTTSQNEMLTLVDKLNNDATIDGILIQLPLPSHLNASEILMAVDPTKDIDGLHPLNAGKLLLGDETGFVPCTPGGIKTLLETYKISLESKHVVIVGRSSLVGKPLAALFMQKKPGLNATVTVAHRGTQHLSEITRQADVLVAAIGSPHFIKEEMVNAGAVVIDVGINKIRDDQKDRLVGDVDFDRIAPKCSWITPVPGGVGPMTIAQLLLNTFISFQRRAG